MKKKWLCQGKSFQRLRNFANVNETWGAPSVRPKLYLVNCSATQGFSSSCGKSDSSVDELLQQDHLTSGGQIAEAQAIHVHTGSQVCGIEGNALGAGFTIAIHKRSYFTTRYVEDR
jgi:hypothetical protein